MNFFFIKYFRNFRIFVIRNHCLRPFNSRLKKLGLKFIGIVESKDGGVVS